MSTNLMPCKGLLGCEFIGYVKFRTIYLDVYPYNGDPNRFCRKGHWLRGLESVVELFLKFYNL